MKCEKCEGFLSTSGAMRNPEGRGHVHHPDIGCTPLPAHRPLISAIITSRIDVGFNRMRPGRQTTR